MMDGSFSMTSVRAQEQVMAEHRNTLMMSIIRNMRPNAIHRYISQAGVMPYSLSHDSPTADEVKKKINVYELGLPDVPIFLGHPDMLYILEMSRQNTQ